MLDGQETRKTAEIKTEDGKKERYYLYFDGETVSGKVGSSGSIFLGLLLVLCCMQQYNMIYISMW